MSPTTGPSRTPHGPVREPTEAFADAITARFSRSPNSLIPLTPNVEHLSPALSTPSSSSLLSSSSAFSPPLSSPPSQTPLHVSHPASPSLPLSSPTLYPPSAFTAVRPSDLPSILADTDALILDIRSHNSFSIARLPSALSLSVPSTLLKRPLYSLSKLALMLPSPSARSRFSLWSSASAILVYDADSSVLGDNSNLLGLMRKFRNEGFRTDKVIYWLRGGFHAVWRERGDLVDREPPHEEEEEDEVEAQRDNLSIQQSMPTPLSGTSVPFPSSSSAAPPGGSVAVLRTKHLSKLAFTQSSTTSQRASHTSAYFRSVHSEIPSQQPHLQIIPSTPMLPRADPFSLLPPPASATMSAPSNPSQSTFTLRLPPSRSGSIKRPSTQAENAAVAQGMKTPTDAPGTLGAMSPSKNISDRSKVQATAGLRQVRHPVPSATPVMAFNPFFDNIRQNIELARGVQEPSTSMLQSRSAPGLGTASLGGGGGDEGIPLKLPRKVRRRVGELPFEWLREIARRSGKVRAHGESVGGEQEQEHDESGEGEDVEESKIEGRQEGRGIWKREGTEKSKEAAAEKRTAFLARPRSPRRDPHMSSSPERRPSSPTSRFMLPSSRDSSPSGSPSVSRDRSMEPSNRASDSHSTSQSPSRRPSRSTSPTNSSAEDLTRELATQFYRIELGEQMRLMGIMEHHSKESGVVQVSSGNVPGTGVSGMKGVASGKNYSSVTGFPTAPIVPSGSTATRSASLGGVSRLKGRMRVKVDEEMVGVEAPSPAPALASAPTPALEPAFPYSITAGVEKGAKNRYRNIWPFEHARVRLLSRKRGCIAPPDSSQLGSSGVPGKRVGWEDEDEDDYMNASFVQPLGTTKRYIATQGPLPATFNDFWTLCWEQNVHVIIMLTREIESALAKCGKYWSEGTYGRLQLKLLDTNDSPEWEERRQQREKALGFFGGFGAAAGGKGGNRRHGQHRYRHHKSQDDPTSHEPEEDEEPHTIRRVFRLTNLDYPNVPPRIVTQLQYLEWPDLNVPDDPRGILELMWEMEELVDGARESGDRKWGEGPLRYTYPHPHQPGHHQHHDSTSSSSREDSVPVSTKPSSEEVAALTAATTTTLGDTSEVDPTTGIAKNAIGNPPVLLHCSAGVGRTGGFIAINAILDGVRREMRKRRQARAARSHEHQSQSTHDESSASPPDEPIRVDSGASESPKNMGGESRGSSRGVAMEVDSLSPSPPRAMSSMDISTEDDGDVSEVPARAQLPSTGGAAGLTVAVPVGHTEVHVPVAGFSGPLLMTMDLKGGETTRVGHQATTTTMKGREREKKKVAAIKPSSDLVSEVKRATLMNKLAASNASSSSGAVHDSETSSESAVGGIGRGSLSQAAASGDSGSGSASHAHSHSGSGSASNTGCGSGPNSHFGSGAGSRTGSSGHFSVSPVSSHTGSFTSLSLVAAASPPPHAHAGTASRTAPVAVAVKVAGKGAGGGGGKSVRDHQDQDQAKFIKLGTDFAGGASLRTGLSHHDAIANVSLSRNSHSALGVGVGGGVGEVGKSGVTKAASLAVPATLSPKTSRPHDTTQSSRLDTWRSEVAQDVSSEVAPDHRYHKSRGGGGLVVEGSGRETSDESLPSQGEESAVGFQQRGGVTTTFDYAQPRPLHDDSSPPLLSTYDEPIRRVIEDMREQRMSLCQSLRQYVFVHRAIIEGALMIVDEERARDEEKKRKREEWKASIQTVLGGGGGVESSLASDMPGGGGRSDVVPNEVITGIRKHGLGSSSNTGNGRNEDMGRGSEGVDVPGSSGGDVHATGSATTATNTTSTTTMVSPGRPKRGASPTELLHEGAKGEVRLIKRPSVKRKPRSSDEDSERALPF